MLQHVDICFPQACRARRLSAWHTITPRQLGRCPNCHQPAVFKQAASDSSLFYWAESAICIGRLWKDPSIVVDTYIVEVEALRDEMTDFTPHIKAVHNHHHHTSTITTAMNPTFSMHHTPSPYSSQSAFQFPMQTATPPLPPPKPSSHEASRRNTPSAQPFPDPPTAEEGWLPEVVKEKSYVQSSPLQALY